MLQKNRARLLTPRDVTPQEAARVMSQVGELVLADPLLRADGEAVLVALAKTPRSVRAESRTD